MHFVTVLYSITRLKVVEGLKQKKVVMKNMKHLKSISNLNVDFDVVLGH